jgi:hypothetical protein
MNVGFHQTRRYQAAGQILRRSACFGKFGLNGGETAAANADIDRVFLRTRDPCIADNKIERHDAFPSVGLAGP